MGSDGVTIHDLARSKHIRFPLRSSSRIIAGRRWQKEILFFHRSNDVPLSSHCASHLFLVNLLKRRYYFVMRRKFDEKTDWLRLRLCGCQRVDVREWWEDRSVHLEKQSGTAPGRRQFNWMPASNSFFRKRTRREMENLWKVKRERWVRISIFIFAQNR